MFTMEICIPEKTVFILKRGPGSDVRKPNRLAEFDTWLRMFFSQWHMVVNLTKTNVVFNSWAANNVFSFVFNANDVPISKLYNYSGVIFTMEAY